MDLKKARELNNRIIEESMSKVEKAIDSKNWDCECFETMSKSIDNILDIVKIEKYTEKDKVDTYRKEKKNAFTEETEFETLIYKIAEEKKDVEGMLAITTVLAELMEELRIMHPRMYDLTMIRLKGLM